MSVDVVKALEMTIIALLILGCVVYILYSFHIGLRDYRDWKGRQDYILDILNFPYGTYPRYTKAAFGIRDVIFLPSLVVIVVGIIIYKMRHR